MYDDEDESALDPHEQEVPVERQNAERLGALLANLSVQRCHTVSRQDALEFASVVSDLIAEMDLIPDADFWDIWYSKDSSINALSSSMGKGDPALPHWPENDNELHRYLELTVDELAEVLFARYGYLIESSDASMSDALASEHNDFLAALHVLECSPDASFDDVKLSYDQLVQVWSQPRLSGKGSLQERASQKLTELKRAFLYVRQYLENEKQTPGYNEHQTKAIDELRSGLEDIGPIIRIEDNVRFLAGRSTEEFGDEMRIRIIHEGYLPTLNEAFKICILGKVSKLNAMLEVYIAECEETLLGATPGVNLSLRVLEKHVVAAAKVAALFAVIQVYLQLPDIDLDKLADKLGRNFVASLLSNVGRAVSFPWVQHVIDSADTLSWISDTAENIQERFESSQE